MAKSKFKNYFKNYLFYDIQRLLIYWLFYLWYRPKYYYVNGKETKNKIKLFSKSKNKLSAIVVSNHNSFFDAMHVQMSFGLRRHIIIGADDLELNKAFKWFTKKMLSVYISRENLSLKSFREIICLLKNNKIVHFFAEGEIQKDDQTFGEFKDGASVFSITAKTPIIPMYIPQRKNVFKRLIVCYNDPIDVTNYTKEDIKKLTNETHDKCLECIKYLKNINNKL